MNSDISALMDGELDAREAGQLIGRMKQDASLRETWATYHLIGDSLRSAGALATDLSARVATRLAAEPTVLAPGKKPSVRRPFPALAVAASFAAVGFVGLLAWQIVHIGSTPATVPVSLAAKPGAAGPVQLASREDRDPKPGEGQPRVQFSEAASEAYLLAHQEFSPSYAVVGMPAYVRTVSEQENGQ